MINTRIDPRKKYWLIERPYGRLGAQVVDGKVFVHCDIWEWSPAVLKDCKQQWHTFLEHFRRHGVKRIYSGIPENSGLVNKWQRLWDMEEIKRENGVVFYVKEL